MGDAHGDGMLNVADAITVLGYLFGDNGTLLCDDAADSNDDASLDISDSIYFLAYLFSNGPALPHPFPDCGAEALPADGLDCAAFPLCD